MARIPDQKVEAQQRKENWGHKRSCLVDLGNRDQKDQKDPKKKKVLKLVELPDFDVSLKQS